MNQPNRSPPRRCLWKPSGDDQTPLSTSESVRQQYSFRPAPKRFWSILASSLVVVQEICLVAYLLIRHRIAQRLETSSPTVELQHRMDLSTFAMLSGLLLVLWYSAKAEREPQQTRKTKVRQRALDGLLLAALLRLSASFLQSLTASFSSDTVDTLVGIGMILHLVACDYSYANGKEPIAAAGTTPTASNRPYFQGGTFSLNAVLFSTTLLMSRLSSSLSAFFFVSLSIVMFAFYPVTRSAIAASYHPKSSVALWLITVAIFIATALLLDNAHELLVLVAILTVLGLVVPAWRCIAQTHKLLLRGPWDIPTLASMKIDYQNN